VIVGLLTLVGQQLTVGFADMRDQIMVGVQGIVEWLASMGVTTDQWNDIFENLGETVRNNSQQILSGALGFGSTAGNIAAGTVLAIFALIFFLYDGQRIWRFCLNFVPRRHREAIDGAGKAGWNSLGSYVRVQIFVAFVDALGIGAGAWILGVPLALPLGVLVFFGSFIPLVGAFLTGAVAVLLALVANGPVNALIMLAVLGLVGAIFAVPLMAFLNATIKYFNAKPWLEDEPEPVPVPVREGTLKERVAELEGPWGRAYETIDGVVRKATGSADAPEGHGSTSVAERRKARRALKRSQTRARFLPRRWRVQRETPSAVGEGPTTASTSPDDGNVRGGTLAGEDNTGMDRSGHRPDQDGGHQ
jgi:hypothetical protein